MYVLVQMGSRKDILFWVEEMHTVLVARHKNCSSVSKEVKPVAGEACWRRMKPTSTMKGHKKVDTSTL